MTGGAAIGGGAMMIGGSGGMGGAMDSGAAGAMHAAAGADPAMIASGEQGGDPAATRQLGGAGQAGPSGADGSMQQLLELALASALMNMLNPDEQAKGGGDLGLGSAGLLLLLDQMQGQGQPDAGQPLDDLSAMQSPAAQGPAAVDPGSASQAYQAGGAGGMTGGMLNMMA